MFNEPPEEIRDIWTKKGLAWSVTDRHKVTVWLNQPEQWLILKRSGFAVLFRYGGQEQDVEDAWQEFQTRRAGRTNLDYCILSYEPPPVSFPGRLMGFWINFCRTYGRDEVLYFTKRSAEFDETIECELFDNTEPGKKDYLERLRRLLEEGLNKLTNKNYRMILIKVFFEGKSYAEIAEEMGIPDIRILKVWLWRAIQELRKEINPREIAL